MDKVIIESLSLNALIGVYDFERHAKQRVIVDLVLYTDLTKASFSDDVNDTLDYGHIAERLNQLAETTSFKLLEALGKAMIDMLFAEFSVNKLELTLSKPDILDSAKSVGVCFHSQRPDL